MFHALCFWRVVLAECKIEFFIYKGCFLNLNLFFFTYYLIMKDFSNYVPYF